MAGSMKVVVITGSTRGIGLGMAHEFLKRGCCVVISGRSQASVDKALATLRKDHKPDHVAGFPCEVSEFAQVQTLWDASVKQFGRVDIWINNAGMDIVNKPLWDVPHSNMKQIVDVNLLGVMYGSQVALIGMRQQGSGQLYNMEGFGSDGRMTIGMTSYGTTKYGLRYFTQSLQKEVKGTAVQVGTLSPGMVLTDLLLEGYEDDPANFERVKKIFNILADKVETVTPFLAENVLKNEKNGASIAWLTTPKIIFRFMTAPFNKRDLFADYVRQP